jgi:ribosomal protein S18 acetylase RimI-like enzyme
MSRLIDTRWSTEADAESLAALHRDAWRHAYAGIIPGVVLERMVARRGTGWWQRLHDRGHGALLIEFDGDIAGYATLGPARRQPRDGGEIYELYVRPECQGVGFGRRLFRVARAELATRGLRRLVVWSLADNEIGCRFYRALGGRERARGVECLHGHRLPTIGFAWS